ncbi:unnamed protein product [Symbiodinium sp. CCMP2592]|nr:unnamed protein product [Symbiodinium sp. CCMP2592]
MSHDSAIDDADKTACCCTHAPVASWILYLGSWESGIMSCIFGNGALEHPVLRQPCPPALEDSVTPAPEDVPCIRVRSAPCTLFEKSFSARADISTQDEDDHLWVLAVNKWCCIFSLAQSDPGQVGEQAAQCLIAEGESARDELIRDVFGIKSPRTATKRANSLLRCLRWHLRERRAAWPWDCDSFTDFVKSLGVAASAVTGLFEAMNFAHHVMGMPFCKEILEDRRLQGRAKRLEGDRAEVKQQDPLSVECVAKLEKLVASNTLCDADTYVLGGIVFCLYSRSRWSDLRNLLCIWVDFESEDHLSGFVEARTRDHKTSNTAQTKRRAMPLVAPFPGVTDANWVGAWWNAGLRLGVQWDADSFGPLVRAPDAEGQLCKRRCTSSEAGDMLCNALDLDGDQRRTSHVLKGTTLAWVGKRGFGERDGLLLGHHAPGSGSLACYSRELLSAPLRAYRAMLAEIRTNVFRPDSGAFGLGAQLEQEPVEEEHPTEVPGELEHYYANNLPPDLPESSQASERDRDDGSWHHVGQPLHNDGEQEPGSGSEVLFPELFGDAARETELEGCDSSSSDSSSSSCSSNASETEEQTITASGVCQPFEIKEPCWQHVKLKMLHRPQGGQAACKTKCGRRTANVYRWLDGSYFKWPRCAVCWKVSDIRQACNIICFVFDLVASVCSLVGMAALSLLTSTVAALDKQCERAGLSAPWVDALKAAGVTTLGKLSYAVTLPGNQPSSDDMDAFIVALRPGASITLGDSSALKQLIFEAQTMTVAELRSSMQATDEVPRKLPASERSMRIEAQKRRLSGLPLEGPLAVAHCVYDKIATMRENDELKYLAPNECITRDAETTAAITLDSDLALYQAMMRRALAMDLVGLASYACVQRWNERLFRIMSQDPPPEFQRVSRAQVLRADRQCFLELARVCNGNLKPGPDGSLPLDKEFKKLEFNTTVMYFLLPVKGRGNGGGKADKEGKGRKRTKTTNDDESPRPDSRSSQGNALENAR